MALAVGAPTDELEPPELSASLLLIYQAFWELSTDRQIGMAPGPIPAASIERHTAGWPDDDAESFRFIIREMDRAYLSKPETTETETSDNPARDAFRGAFR